MGTFWENDLLTFETDIIGYDLEKENGWTPDCMGKQDYDPSVARFSCRVWRDGTWTANLLIGIHEIKTTGIMSADGADAAKQAVEAWVSTESKRIAKTLRALYSEPKGSA